MTVAWTITDLVQRLGAVGVPTPAVDAELLLRHVTGWARGRLLTCGPDPISDHLDSSALAQLEDLANRRIQREPLQLILGTVGFRYLELQVRPGVFIPRPETELLAGLAIQRTPPGGIVVEPCTGTGAIACTVAAESGAQTVVASDAATAAVRLARENVLRCGVDVAVAHGDLLAPIDRALRGQVDVLVANPPYVAAAEMIGLEPEVAQWDPLAALVSGPTGHECSDRLITMAHDWLRPGGWLLLEVAAVRANDCARRASTAGLVEVEVIADLTGRDRFVCARSAVQATR